LKNIKNAEFYADFKTFEKDAKTFTHNRGSYLYFKLLFANFEAKSAQNGSKNGKIPFLNISQIYI
jgi:hypothetical protein